MMCLTWNVNEQRPDPESKLFKWVSHATVRASIAVVALQEIEMGGSSVAMAAAKDVLNKSAQVSLWFWVQRVAAAQQVCTGQPLLLCSESSCCLTSLHRSGSVMRSASALCTWPVLQWQ